MKKYLITFFTTVFVMISTAMPNIVYDPDMEYGVIHIYHRWLTPYVYQLIYSNSKDLGISAYEICGLIQEESNGDTKAISCANARGLMQVMPFHNGGNSTALHDESLNIYLGSKYYKWCLQYAHGNKKEALRFYNAGPASNRQNYRNWRYVNDIIAHAGTTKRMIENYKIIVE
jgi:soluble lytic murein transglycosylase-like protein